jgi:peptidyl-prolyl cis-trans isomerase A (cyclophilin A)
MELSIKKALTAVSALALAGAVAFAQSGAQSSTAGKPASTQSKTSTAAKPGTTAAKPAGPGYDKALLTPSALVATAPAEFDVKFATSKGDFTVHVTRAWAPKGADRFYNLARHHFFDGAYFFRVIPGFVAQFGISAYPAVAKVWDNANIKDDPVTHHNVPGTIVFATAGPNTRTSQLFINYRDNTSNLDPQGFAPFGEVTSGMDVVKALSGKYGGDLDQDKIRDGGKDYVQAHYPEMDLIKTATLVLPPAAPKTGAAAKPATSH